ncbi:hypothetical protein ABB37_04571 [Leptomonas pyrrhocoris]|uniref:Protein phosphatase inhibitor 2 (IPP-2) n=1 Tax=Leptomonas pyrrhocoris TaxID=157538 RepID=A0A0M9G1I5_LEPPY|nr:hypothetical protein ABB37_04571 [Leptomonas pyrrhocoris]XP_015658715.1 hypothetical protein ABB37_04571 [Leptomonas pyrrhocoris]KPA80275.1 hypothetical protein ABB37_04571 [Leptomonas pyrrhocoris]KPA80276.1 hypothetical protein ABB37_04571 [Leptomonas pyrrhocoris]|eukprot:XP_015658714.1 hypothetical protein ABB37_04571 [Leptomonas pyrrhocoris]
MSGSKHVEWDEQNLTANAEYQRQHPVTLHITEPKTPYSYVDGEDMEEDEERSEIAQKWDPAVNAKVKEMREQIESDMSERPKAPLSKSGRPMLHPGTATGELMAEQHKREFSKMRKAVYADEGAMFKKALEQRDDDDEDDEEQEG